jgi:predicted nucleic acid-binding protein
VISALDTNVLLDVMLRDPVFGLSSAAALRTSYDAGGLVICDVVYAELAPRFADRAGLEEALAELNIRTQELGREAAFRGGKAWQQYRRRGGTRERILPDFLIGAHALVAADRLVSRDRGFYGQCFPDLALLDPTGGVIS